jgi:hypothetical protein
LCIEKIEKVEKMIQYLPKAAFHTIGSRLINRPQHQYQYLQRTNIRFVSSETIQQTEKTQTPRPEGRDPSFDTIEDEIAAANTRYKNSITIHETSDRGWGLMTNKKFSIGQKVMTATAIASIPRNSHTVQKGWDEHILIDLPARFVNHSCDPNLGIHDNDVGAYDFFAIKDIDEGEELLWDYEASEYEISAFDTCMCGAKRCRGSMGGFKKNGEEIKRNYGNHIANYLKEND